MNTGYKEYATLAYKRSIVSSVQRFIQEHLSAEAPATKMLLCEEVLASDREVPEDAFLSYLEQLQQEENELRLQLSQFEFIRRSDVRRKQEEPQSAEVQGGGKVEASPDAKLPPTHK